MEEGADLRAHDPAAGDNAWRLLPDLVVVSTPDEALEGADAAVIATEWPIYRDLDWAALQATMGRPLIIDGRRLLPFAQLRSMGYEVVRIGDGVPYVPDLAEDEVRPRSRHEAQVPLR